MFENSNAYEICCGHWLPRREPEGEIDPVHVLPAFDEFVVPPAMSDEFKEVENV